MDSNSKIPLYLQLVDTLINKIENKEYSINEKLPSEREFCEMYSMSRITVRNALQELEREGYIYKHHGKGTFVAPQIYKQKLVNVYSFTEEMTKLGKQPATKVLSFKRIPSDNRLAEKLGIKSNEDVFQIIRLRSADGEPLMYETSYIPQKKFPGLSKEDLEKSPMYSLFANNYDVSPTKVIEQFSATSLRNKEAKYLESESDRPAMLIVRYAYNGEDVIEYTISVTLGEKFKYTVELT